MKIEQFFDDALAHASYGVISQGEMAVVDPGRDPKPYEDFAEANDARITAVFETHPHADFVSCHLELHKKYGAKVYIHPGMKADYPHHPLDHGDEVALGDMSFRALFTPGHSPDHNSYLLIDADKKPQAVFTGDSLFVGDVGRPDLRENAGNVHGERRELAEKMYRTMREVFDGMPDEVMVYPAHGKGSLCGKNMSSDTFSTIGKERERNWAMKTKDKEEFLRELLEGQPYVPKYFPFDVSVNASGTRDLEESVKDVPRIKGDSSLEEGKRIIDTRPAESYRKGHIPGSWNIPDGGKFETWLGSLVGPEESFYLLAEDENALEAMIRKSAKIGYESLIEGAMVPDPARLNESSPEPDVEAFKEDPSRFRILDVRNKSEVEAEGPIFSGSINIPLPELPERVGELPQGGSLVVHCAGGYRSALAASIISSEAKIAAEDLGPAIESFKVKDEA